MTEEIIRTMALAASEIRHLRRSNEILSAQVHVMNVFAKALGLTSDKGYGEDIAWRLEQTIRDLKDNSLKSTSNEPI